MRSAGAWQTAGRLAAESVRNLWSRALFWVLFAGLLLTVVASTATSDAVTSVDLHRRSLDLRHAGYHILQIAAPAAGATPIAAPDCERLGAIPGVRAASWFGPEQEAMLGADPVSLVATGRDLVVLVASVESTRLADGALLVPAGLVPGAVHGRRWTEALTHDGKRVPVTVLAVDDVGLGAIPASSVLYPTVVPHDGVTCLAAVEVTQREFVRRSVSNRFPATGGYSVGWIPPGADLVEAPRVIYESRASRRYWLVAAVVGASATALAMRIRRSELGVYRLSGVGAVHTGLVVVVELVIAWSAVALVARIMLSTGLTTRDVEAVAARQILLAYLAGLWCSLVVAAAAVPSKRKALERLRD